MSKPTKAIEIPFDLNSIFSLSYGFEPLKQIIEHIYGVLGQQEAKTNEVEMKMVAKFMQIEQ